MEEIDIKNEYQKLAKKYNLPDYDELDLDFEISTIEKKKFLLREIRRKILDKIDGIKEILESVIQPDANSFSSIYESRIFDDEGINMVYTIYKTVMILNRTATIVNLRADEKEEAEYIKNTFIEWQKLKPNLINYLEKIKNEWQKETSVKEDLGYLG